jgi:hypothetical protein
VRARATLDRLPAIGVIGESLFGRPGVLAADPVRILAAPGEA